MKSHQLCHVKYAESSKSQRCLKCGEHLIPASIAFSHTFVLFFLFFIKFNHKSCLRYPYDPCNHYLKFTILISNSPKWRPAWQCKHCDLWSGIIRQSSGILLTFYTYTQYTGWLKCCFKCLVQGSAISARSAMTGSITSESNDGKPPPHTSDRPCFAARSHVGHASVAS